MQTATQIHEPENTNCVAIAHLKGSYAYSTQQMKNENSDKSIYRNSSRDNAAHTKRRNTYEQYAAPTCFETLQ